MLVYFEDDRNGLFTPNKIYDAISYDRDINLEDDSGTRRYVHGGKFNVYTGPVPAGFILWGGGECPVGDVEVEIFRRGDKKPGDRGEHTDFASSYRWTHNYGIGDIIAYRIVKDKEVEEFKVRKGDYIRGVQQLSEQGFQCALDSFKRAGFNLNDSLDSGRGHWQSLGIADGDGDVYLFDDPGLETNALREITYEQLTGEPLSEKKEDCPKQGDWFSHQGMSDKQYEEAVSIFSSAGANIDLDYCVTDDRHGWTHTHWDVDGDLDQVIFDSIGKGGQEWFSDWPRLSEKEGVKSDEEAHKKLEQEFEELNEKVNDSFAEAMQEELERREKEERAKLEQCMSSIKSALSTQQGGTHYKDMAIQPIEFIVANNLEYRVGNVIKYACRHKNKNGAEDIRKAIHYLEMILETDYACGRSSTSEPT